MIDLRQGDCRELIRTLADCSVDACVTDPPYALTSGKKGGSGEASVNLESPYGRARITTGFMGQKWDNGEVAHDPVFWREVLRVLKPGGHLLAFGGSRTYHRLACAIEDAGFDIRDMLSWNFGSGFPKSHNGEWGGTALKPAHEPIVLARKPMVGTVEENWSRYGTGALNIDGCRIPLNGDYKCGANGRPSQTGLGDNYDPEQANQHSDIGRWPANLILDEAAGAILDEQTGPQHSGGTPPRRPPTSAKTKNAYGTFNGEENPNGIGSSSGKVSRFFYCPKADRQDRNDGCEGLERKPLNWSSGEQNPGSFQAEGTDRTSPNFHPTVKPTDLMRWLVRLVVPKGGTVLDPFMGSGSTGRACVLEWFDFIGFEREPEYVEIARRRIAAADGAGTLFGATA